MTKSWSTEPVPKGSSLVAPAAATPGSAATRASTASKKRVRLPRSAYVLIGGVRLKVTRRVASNPGSIAWRWRRLRRSSPAPTRSTRASATCETTSAPRRRCRTGAAPVRPPSFNEGTSDTREACRPGTRPNTMPVISETPAVKARTRGSRRTESRPGIPGGLVRTTKSTSQFATSSPARAPRAASSTLSARSCRTSLRRPAPSEARIATSFSRAAARASRRLATLVAAIRSTNTTAPSRSTSAPRTSWTRNWCKGTSTYRIPLFSSGYAADRRAAIASMSPWAWGRLARRRPTARRLCAPRAAASSGDSTRNGAQTSASASGRRKPGAATPITSYSPVLKRTVRPTTSGTPASRRCQKPWLRTITRRPPGRSSSGCTSRPSAARAPRTRKRSPVTTAPSTRSAGPLPVRSRKWAR